MGYAENVLGITTLTPAQKDILRHLLMPPYKVLVPSAHDTGKTFVAAVALNWWYDSFNPGVVISTAPTKESVKDLLWTEVRLQRQRARVPLPQDFTGDRAPEMWSSPDHYAKGYTTDTGDSFQGRHRWRLLFIFDEATGIDPEYFRVTKTMFDPELQNAWLVIFNPTDTTAQVKHEDDNAWKDDGTPRWHRFPLSALDHPNVQADLRGEPRPVPGAVSLAMFQEWLEEGCEPVAAGDRVATDLEWPPGSGKWVRPGPDFQARGLGMWPDAGGGVWSDPLWRACTQPREVPYPLGLLPEIGCDTATGKGSDYIAIHARWGAISLHHETSNTMDAVTIFGKLKEVAADMADLVNTTRPAGHRPVRPQEVLIKIDDDGTGGAVVAMLNREKYNCRAVGAGCAASEPTRYPRKRDELWFQAAAKARAGLVYLGRLDRITLRRLKQQLMAPAWKHDLAGRRVVERKEGTREKIGRSPDDADALNLAYLEDIGGGMVAVEPEGPPRSPATADRRNGPSSEPGSQWVVERGSGGDGGLYSRWR